MSEQTFPQTLYIVRDDAGKLVVTDIWQEHLQGSKPIECATYVLSGTGIMSCGEGRQRPKLEIVK